MTGITADLIAKKRWGKTKAGPWSRYMQQVAPHWVALQEKLKYNMQNLKKHKPIRKIELIHRIMESVTNYQVICQEKYADYLNEQIDLLLQLTLANANISLDEWKKMADMYHRHMQIKSMGEKKGAGKRRGK